MKIKRVMQLFFISLVPAIVYAVEVTFLVDMQNEAVSDGVYIVPYGGFGTSDIIQMSDEDGDKIYQVIRELSAHESLYYIFKNGTSLEENNFSNCGGSSASRQHVVSNTNETVGPVCFSRCFPCDKVMVTYQVDMKNEDASEDGIYFSFLEENIVSLGMVQSAYSDEIYATSYIHTLGDTIKYRFLNGSDHEVISELSNCIIEIDGGEIYRYHIVGDIQAETLEPVCFNHCHNCVSVALSSLTFEVNVINAVNSNGLDLGDPLLVRWGYGNDGIPGENTDTLSRLDILSYPYIYSVSLENIIINKDYGLYYQYYRSPVGESDREIYYNFEYTGSETNLSERRYFSFDEISEYSEVIISDTENSQVVSRRMPIFNNDEPIGDTLTVTYTVDLRPAYYQVLSGATLYDEQGDIDVVIADSVFAWGVWMNGPATEPLTGQSWTSWGSTLFSTIEKQMHDDGVKQGDVTAGDSIYTLQITYDSNATIGQEFKFGIKGGDNEGGYGNNHNENMSAQYPIIASYWGSIDPVFYDEWNYDTTFSNLAIINYETPSPHQFTLGENYPNPFNPSTSFEFTIPQGAGVILNIYDLNGRLVSTVHNAYTMPGTYRATWNAMSEASGVYFYELSAEPYYKQRGKMTLIK